jgi:hypothetical protein
MFSFHRSFVKTSAATLLGFAFAFLATGAIGAVATDLQKSVSSYAAAGKYREASAAAFQLAEAHKRAGETAKSCTALAQSLEYYRKANAADEPAASSLRDGSDGMAEVRAKFGCK